MKLKIFLRKIKNRFFHRFLGKLFYQKNQDFYEHPTVWKKIRLSLNQMINEKGWQTPFIYTREECAEFWKSIDNASTSSGNRPNIYSIKNSNILEFLMDFWTPEVSLNDSILELGCNCGANLYWLNKLGYKDLTGVEINPHAIYYLHQTFPEFAKNTPITEGDIVKVLPEMKSDSINMIFTMGVSMHIHPKNNFLFGEMVRVSKKYICTIEPEASNSNYVFARNYERIFSALGAVQIKSTLIDKKRFSHLENHQALTVRLFSKK